MSRRRFWFNPKTKAVEELSVDFEPTPRLEIISDSYLDGARSTEGIDISSRKKHREYMHVNGYALASDYKDTWARARKKRDDFYSAQSYEHGKEIGRAVDKAWHSVFGEGRKRR
jgi:hypothetical protein